MPLCQGESIDSLCQLCHAQPGLKKAVFFCVLRDPYVGALSTTTPNGLIPKPRTHQRASTVYLRSHPDGSLAAAGVEGGFLVVRVQSADRAPEDVHLPAAGDRPGYHPHPIRHYLEEHSCGDGGRSGALAACEEFGVKACMSLLRVQRMWVGANDFEDTCLFWMVLSGLLPLFKGVTTLTRFWAFYKHTVNYGEDLELRGHAAWSSESMPPSVLIGILLDWMFRPLCSSHYHALCIAANRTIFLFGFPLYWIVLDKVVSLDRRFLDPRRPQEEPTKTEKEEKLIQYQPYLPVVPTQVLSYHKVRGGRK